MDSRDIPTRTAVFCLVDQSPSVEWERTFRSLAVQDADGFEIHVAAEFAASVRALMAPRKIGVVGFKTDSSRRAGASTFSALSTSYCIVIDRPVRLSTDYVRLAGTQLDDDVELDLVYGDRRIDGVWAALIPAREIDRRSLLHTDIVSPAAMFRTGMLREVGGPDESFGPHMMWEFHVRALIQGKTLRRSALLSVTMSAIDDDDLPMIDEVMARALLVERHRTSYGPIELAWSAAILSGARRAADDKSRRGVIPSLSQEATAKGENNKPLGLVWEGTQFVTHSLALINRELSLRQIAHGHELAIRLYEDHAFGADVDPRFRSLAERFDRRLPGSIDVHIRHQWPPRLDAPDEGRWVVIQPWEWGAVPKTWVKPFAAEVDEIWTPSAFVRSCYFRAGIPAERVHVIPNGFDPTKFSSDGPQLRLKTKKRFKFLFVGGTIRRKGIDCLLEAYRRAFTVNDDVCLVVKDLGGASFYRGQTLFDQMSAAFREPNAPEIEYLDKDFDESTMAALYRAADVLVHPYRGEGFGLPILEAMACGKPVVVTGYGPALEFTDDDCAWYIPAREVRTGRARVGDLETTESIWLAEPDLDVLTERLRAVVVDVDGVRRKGVHAARRAHGGYTWSHVDQLVQERLLVVASRPSRRHRCAVDGEGRSVLANPLIGLLVESASAAWTRGALATAEAHLNAALDRHPTHADALVLASNVARAGGRHDEAAHYSARALKAAPKHPEALAGYMALCRELGHEVGALEAERALRSIAPGHPALQRRL